MRAVFFGLGSDGTVGANKNTIKILGSEEGLHAQGYFVYDSKKSGSQTVSHLRFGPRPIRAPYLVQQASFVGCHQFGLLDRADVLGRAADGATLLLNCARAPAEVWDALSRPIQEQILAKHIDVYVIDAGRIAREVGLAGRINIVLQTCFFAISGVLPREQAIERIKAAVAKTYGRRGAEVVERNQAAVDRALEGLHRVEVPERATASRELPPVVPAHAPEFVRTVTAEMMAGRGDDLPVSALPVDGTYPSGTAAYEKRNISELVAVWDSDLCIQCGNCSFVCPHSVIRSRYYDQSRLEGAPDGFRSAPLDAVGLPDTRYTLQVYVEDCTGCGLCVEACPVVAPGDPVRKAINLAPREPLVAAERDNIAFFETLPANDRSRVDFGTVRGTQFLEPLFEFSGACAGCGETPYLKLLSQLFGDRLMVANATGCSSIYGGNLPTTPWTTDADGRGPAWSNSLFEDNAEFGLGFRLAADRHTELARRRLAELRDAVGAELVDDILDAPQLRRVGAAGAARAGGRAEAAARRAGRAGRRRPAQRRRPPRAAQRLDRRRRRLGLRHRLGRARPRPGQRAQRQRAGARHRGLLQHRRPDVEGDAARRRRQVRRRRQDRAQEGPRPAGDRLRQRLRRPGRDGRRSPADADRLPRGGGLRRPLAGARLQPLHRARHRHARRARPAVPRRRQRLLAADPLRPDGARRAATRSCSTRRGRASRSPTTPTASCATAR